MKRFASMLITIGMICLSPWCTAQNGNVLSTQPTSTKQIVVRHVPKIKLFRSNPYRYHRIYIDNDDEVTVDDEDIMSPYRREDLVKLVDVDDVSEYVRWRLFLARQLAVLKHNYTIAG